MTIYKTCSLNGGALSPSECRIYLPRNNSRRVPQWCEFENNGPTSTEQLEKLSVDDGRWHPARRSTHVPHGDEWLHSFLQAVGNMLVYCYKSTIVGFVYLTKSAVPWTVCTGTFIQDPPHGKPFMAASAMGSWAQNLAGWLEPSYIFRKIAQFMGPWWLRSC